MNSYIYVITNTENNKKYIGKTSLKIESRFKEHLYRALHHKHDYLPLYAAINKYGVDKFSVKLVEVVSDIKLLNKQEQFWIKKFNSLSPLGYNLTLGGDGTILYDRDKVKELFLQGLRQKEIIALLGISKVTLYRIRKDLGIKYVRQNPLKRINLREVSQYSLDSKFLRKFESLQEAAKFICSTDKSLNENYAALILESVADRILSVNLHINTFGNIHKLLVSKYL